MINISWILKWILITLHTKNKEERLHPFPPSTHTRSFILKCRRLRKLLNLLKYVHNYVLSWKLLSHKTYDFKEWMLKYFLFAWNTWMCCHVDRFVLINFWHDIHFNEMIFVHEHVSEDKCIYFVDLRSWRLR